MRFLFGAIVSVLLMYDLAAAVSGFPDIGYLYPAGGQQGTCVQAVLGGQGLRGATTVHFDHPGITAEIVTFYRPFNNVQRDARLVLTKIMRETAEQRWAEGLARGTFAGPAPWEHRPGILRVNTKALEQIDIDHIKLPQHPLLDDLENHSLHELEHLYVTLFRDRFMRQPNAQLAEMLRLAITIAEDVPTGSYRFRLNGRLGLSEEGIFQVGSLPETCELEHNDPDPRSFFPPPAALTLPVCINGQIMPGDVDVVRFQACAGERLRIRCQARSLVPFLADAVPGWFQAVISIHDDGGREIAYGDDDQHRPDPALTLTIPSEGVYQLRIRDAIYRGREDFTYRVTIDRAVAQARAVLPTNEHTSRDTARALTLPVRVEGILSATGEAHFYTFDGQAGASMVAEIVGRRQDSPLDSVLHLYGPDGSVVAWNDDTVDKHDHLHRGLDTQTHFADSRVSCTLPLEGSYLLRVADVRGDGGPTHRYLLRLGPPQPDFRLWASPSAINLFCGRATPVTVHVQRRDGFAGPIALALVDPPPGFSMEGVGIPSGRDSIRVTISAPGWQQAKRLRGEMIALNIVGRSIIDAQPVERLAQACEDTMQAFLWRHLVESKGLVATVLQSPLPNPAQLVQETPIHLPPGHSERIRFIVQGLDPQQARIELALVEAPEGISLSAVTIEPNQLSFVLNCGDVADELADNLIVEAMMTPLRHHKTKQPLAESKQRTRSVGYLPSIPVIIGCAEPAAIPATE